MYEHVPISLEMKPLVLNNNDIDPPDVLTQVLTMTMVMKGVDSQNLHLLCV